jgi:hypothetical protein
LFKSAELIELRPNIWSLLDTQQSTAVKMIRASAHSPSKYFFTLAPRQSWWEMFKRHGQPTAISTRKRQDAKDIDINDKADNGYNGTATTATTHPLL